MVVEPSLAAEARPGAGRPDRPLTETVTPSDTAGHWWLILLRLPKRSVGGRIGLLFHMLTDLIDCMMTYSKCPLCLEGSPAYALLEWLGQLLVR